MPLPFLCSRSHVLISTLHSFRTIGFHWYNATDIDFFLEAGMTLHVSNGLKVLVPTMRDAFGVTPASHRRKMLAFLVGCLVVSAIAVGVGAYARWKYN